MVPAGSNGSKDGTCTCVGELIKRIISLRKLLTPQGMFFYITILLNFIINCISFLFSLTEL
uniref:Uncharacterized protein n=1 Tax=Heterorhabditis bacteriophora TaxID=37862 RepID=A0A1I7WLS0_HETBA